MALHLKLKLALLTYKDWSSGCFIFIPVTVMSLSLKTAHLVRCGGDGKLGMCESVAHGTPTPCKWLIARVLFCFFPRPRTGETYGKGEIVCGEENTLDAGSSPSIRIHGKADIFYFKTLTFGREGKSVRHMHHWESFAILPHTLGLSDNDQLPPECHRNTLTQLPRL